MDILGIGPLELLFILIIALLVFGPNDLVKAGRTLGKLLRKVVTSPTWHTIQQTSRDLRNLPNKMMREAGLEEDAKQIQRDLNLTGIDNTHKQQINISEWITPPKTTPPASSQSLSDTASTEKIENSASENASPGQSSSKIEES